MVRAFNSRRAEPRDDRGVEKLAPRARPGHCRYIPLFGTGTASISRSTMTSGVMRSDSA